MSYINMLLRPYQFDVSAGVTTAWQKVRNVLAVLPTGGGKTIIFASIIAAQVCATAAIAHRTELVSQISMTLAKLNIKHRIVASKKTISQIIQLQYAELGRSFVDQGAKDGVISIDTLRARHKNDQTDVWFRQVGLWIQDEAHHVLANNKWGIVNEVFPNAYGLGVTATPSRADGMGLGRHHDGLFDYMVQGPSMRWMIDQGYLTDYRIIAPPSDVDESKLKRGKEDYTLPSVLDAMDGSEIFGDIVEHYLKFTEGERGITFVPNVETAQEVATEYNDNGVRAMAVSAETPDHIRFEAVRRLERHELDQLVNVELFGEGFDLPAIGVVNDASPSMSFSRVSQRFGRAARPEYAPGYDLETAEGRKAAIAAGPKPFFKYMDHVGNIAKAGGAGRHPLPDNPSIVWTLDRREKGTRRAKDPDEIPMTTCTNIECFAAYKAILNSCPHCGNKPEPSSRKAPEFVNGDLVELDAEALAKLRQGATNNTISAEDMNKRLLTANLPEHIHRGKMQQHQQKLLAQDKLKKTIQWWAGLQNYKGHDDSQAYKLFYWRFGMDVLSAQALRTTQAVELEQKIRKDMENVK